MGRLSAPSACKALLHGLCPFRLAPTAPHRYQLSRPRQNQPHSAHVCCVKFLLVFSATRSVTGEYQVSTSWTSSSRAHTILNLASSAISQSQSSLVVLSMLWQTVREGSGARPDIPVCRPQAVCEQVLRLWTWGDLCVRGAEHGGPVRAISPTGIVRYSFAMRQDLIGSQTELGQLATQGQVPDKSQKCPRCRLCNHLRDLGRFPAAILLSRPSSIGKLAT